MEYFHLAIFVIPRAYIISKNGSQTQAFFSYFIDFSTPCCPHGKKKSLEKLLYDSSNGIYSTLPSELYRHIPTTKVDQTTLQNFCQFIEFGANIFGILR